MKKNVHVISHSHWDREWYMPFEYHRSYLIKLIDDCLELFENDKDFEHFHLDGHSALIEDYLEIKPENKEKIKEYVKSGKFAMGPWYILQDEFLTSSEANIRNLIVGMDLSREFGCVSKLGYFPDSFGNAGQMPQILSQAGMEAIAFGRGVKPTGMNNEVSDGDYNSQYSELFWESPDGSKLPAILFANWYNNGVEIPKDANAEYWNAKLEAVEKYAATKELLLMNGCDHQPVQRDLSEALKNAREKYPDYNFIHSSFKKYVKDLMANLPDDLTTVKGELISQDTDGWFTLVNTCSSHIDLKVLNRKCEILLENVAEPLSVITMLLGKDYPEAELLYAWKTLMKNHPHDSICGCSCDAVNDEMRTRFLKAMQATEAIINENLLYLAKCVKKPENSEYAFAVVNTSGNNRNGMVSVDLDLRRLYGTENLNASYKEILKTAYDGDFELCDGDGNVIACVIEYKKPEFGYELPDDKFRQPYMAERIKITFEAEDIPAYGVGVYTVKKSNKVVMGSLIKERNTMENDYVKVFFNIDGTVNLYDKKNERELKNILRYEDVADIGHEYTFRPSPGDTPVLSDNATVILVKNTPFLAEYKITTVMNIPKQADSKLKEERETFVQLKDRCAKRSNEFTELKIYTYVSLSKNAKGINVRTEFENTAKDHRLRVLIPAMKTKTHKVESVFESVVRPNSHKECWTYPSDCEHQQGFLMMKDEKSGLSVLNLGIYEYEILNDDTMALTLLRATGELGDWGVFPTELSQQLKKIVLEYEILPFGCECEVYSEITAFQTPLLAVQLTNEGEEFSNVLNWSGCNLRMTAMKKALKQDYIVMRWVNYSDKEQILEIEKTDYFKNLYKSNVIEEKGDIIDSEGGIYKICVKPYEIITLLGK